MRRFGQSGIAGFFFLNVCNNYRWHYDAEEFQWILKLGVWLRTQIERGTTIGQEVGQKFCEHEQRRARTPQTGFFKARDPMTKTVWQWPWPP